MAAKPVVLHLNVVSEEPRSTCRGTRQHPGATNFEAQISGTKTEKPIV